MINSFKKKISKKWVALTTLALGLFWKIGTAKAAIPMGLLLGGYVLAEGIMKLVFGTTLMGMTLTAILGGIMVLLIYTIGGILTALVWILFQTANYNGFIDAPVVVEGWVVVRDISNMFFILILLIIAFATILRVESYSWKKSLPKLLIMAVLINFSKTICGVLIDFGQVIMLTFVNAFKETGPGNLFTTFGVEKLYNISLIAKEDISALSDLGAMLLGLIMLIITAIVVGVFAIILAFRIVMLWILIILSPLAFLAMAIPAGAKYASQWTSEFAKYIVIGPIMAFFLWLALLHGSNKGDLTLGIDMRDKAGVPNATISVMGEGNNMQKFIIAIAFLMGGLMMAQQMGGAVGSVAGKGLDWAKRAPLALGAGGLFMGGWGARKIKSGAISELLAKKQITKDAEGNDVVKWKGRVPGLGGLAGALYGLELRPTKMIQGIKEGLKATAEREEGSATEASAISLKRSGIGGLIKGLGVSRDLTEVIVSPRGFKGFKRVFQATVLGGQKKTSALEKEIKEKKKNRSVTQAEYDEKENEYNRTMQARNEAYKKGDTTEMKKLNDILKKEWPELQSAKSKIVKEGVRAEEDRKIDTLEKKLKSRRPIQTFYADRARDEAISKAGKTLGDNDNEEFLVDAFQDALVNGNKEVAQAVMIHAAKVGHLNEIIQGYKSKTNVYDKSGKLLVKAGDALLQGGYGLNQLVKQALIEDLGIDEQTALAAQSEASTLAKGVRHQNLSETVGTKNGLLYQREVEGPGGQQARARSEARKIDAERFVRDYNRLAWGDEFQTASGREFRLNALGLDNFTEMADIISKEITGRRFNKNAAMNIANDKETILAWAKKLDSSGVKYYDGSANNGKGDYLSYVELAKRLIQFGQSAAQAQKRSTIGGDVKELQRQVLEQQKIPI